MFSQSRNWKSHLYLKRRGNRASEYLLTLDLYYWIAPNIFGGKNELLFFYFCSKPSKENKCWFIPVCELSSVLNQIQGNHSEGWHQTWAIAVHPPILLTAEASLPLSALGQRPSRRGYFSAIFLYFPVCVHSCLRKGASETSNPKSGISRFWRLVATLWVALDTSMQAKGSCPWPRGGWARSRAAAPSPCSACFWIKMQRPAFGPRGLHRARTWEGSMNWCCVKKQFLKSCR